MVLSDRELYLVFPTIGTDGTIYVGADDHSLYAITDNGTQGTLKWSYATGDAIYSCPAIGNDGTIYVGSNAVNFMPFR